MLEQTAIDEKDLRQFSAAVLAYIGDAVFELMVRTHSVTGNKRKIKDIHLETVSLVKAASQAQVVRRIYSELDESEQEIVRRGRNVKNTPPKNVEPGDYHMSTGFEALLGYLYLKGDHKRLGYFLEKALEEI